ncbi:MAG TPA: hypothetical protein VK511_11570 [Gemmatimonadaceae bacterium]|nr:hypothetical protein [Gemmatimonadaceae bacterium]
MLRSTLNLFALCASVAFVACTKSAASSGNGDAASGNQAATQSKPSFGALGAGACDKYLTADVVKKILGTDVDERSTLSAQSCEVRSKATGGMLRITLKVIDGQGFHAYRAYLDDPQPLPGVGDSALTSIAPTVTAIKGIMGCDFDARRGSSPAALDGAERAKALGDLCNKIFADAK